MHPLQDHIPLVFIRKGTNYNLFFIADCNVYCDVCYCSIEHLPTWFETFYLKNILNLTSSFYILHTK